MPALHIGRLRYEWKLVLAILYIQHLRPMGRRGQIELLNHYDMIAVSCQVYRCDWSFSSGTPLPFLRLLKLHNRTVF